MSPLDDKGQLFSSSGHSRHHPSTSNSTLKLPRSIALPQVGGGAPPFDYSQRPTQILSDLTGEKKEKCGIFGIAGPPDAVERCYYGLYALQHRGQESAGIAASHTHLR